jgi:serine/threonine protein kinase
MKDSSPVFKIMDFGVAKCWKGSTLQSTVGTWESMAPEILKKNFEGDQPGEEDYTVEVDYFGIGVLLYFLYVTPSLL